MGISAISETEGKRTYCLASEERREVTPRTARPAADLEIASESAVCKMLPWHKTEVLLKLAAKVAKVAKAYS